MRQSMLAEIEYARRKLQQRLQRVAAMGRRERLFLWLVLVMAASLIIAVLSWLADELGWVGWQRIDQLA